MTFFIQAQLIGKIVMQENQVTGFLYYLRSKFKQVFIYYPDGVNKVGLSSQWTVCMNKNSTCNVSTQHLCKIVCGWLYKYEKVMKPM